MRHPALVAVGALGALVLVLWAALSAQGWEYVMRAQSPRDRRIGR